MSKRNYWLSVFTTTTWQEFLDAGARVTGFPERRWQTVKRIRPGDYLLCYVTKISCWIGILEVVSEPFQDESPIWKDAVFPCRVSVKTVVSLAPEDAISVLRFRDKLTVFRNLRNQNVWSGAFRMAPLQWKESDGEIVVNAIMETKANSLNTCFEKNQ